MADFLDGYLPYLLQKADHHLSRRLHARLQSVGVQVSEWRVLAVLADHGSLSVQEVADVALLPQPTASHTCRRLEDSDLISRVESDEDRRRRILTLTDDGRELVAGLIEDARAAEASQYELISDDPADLVQRLTSLIRDLEAAHETST